MGYNEGLPPDVFGNTPVVWMDCDERNVPQSASLVTHNEAETVRAAAKELFSLKLRNFAYVGFPMSPPWSVRREKLFAEECKAAGYAAPVAIRIAANADDLVSVQEALRMALGALERPCGIFAANDAAGAQVLLAAEATGLKVPEEIAVIGVDDDELICEAASPTLSSVLPDWERGGWMCGEALERQMQGEGELRASFGELGVVRRSSTRFSPSRFSLRVMNAVEFIRLKSADSLCVNDVVSQMRCSRRLAEISFRETTGHSIHDEIEMARLDRAIAFLRRDNMMLGAIAAQCGYQSDTALREAFRRRYGMSMREWRARNKL